MSHVDIIQVWKDEEYRSSLSNAECALLPDKPAGLIELTDAELGAVAGGRTLKPNSYASYSDAL